MGNCKVTTKGGAAAAGKKGIVVCVTSDGLFCPKSVPTRKQDADAIANNNRVLHTVANYDARLQTRYPKESIAFYM